MIDKKQPKHPGELLKEYFLIGQDSGELDVAAVAKKLSVNAFYLTNVFAEVLSVTPELALSLEDNGNGNYHGWMEMQAKHDRWKLRNKK